MITTTNTNLRETAVRAILAEVRKGYTVDEAVKRLIEPRRDLADEHDSQTCDCEMCVAAEEYEVREAAREDFPVSGGKNVPTASGSVRIAPPSAADTVQSSFDALWSRTPLVIRESTEEGIAEYFYRTGYADAREVMIETTNDDLVEIRRLAGERLR